MGMVLLVCRTSKHRHSCLIGSAFTVLEGQAVMVSDAVGFKLSFKSDFSAVECYVASRQGVRAATGKSMDNFPWLALLELQHPC